MSHLQDTKDEINKWADKYEKALQDGVFGDQEEPTSPTPMTSDNPSFFGLQNNRQLDDVRDVDAEYWKKVHSASNYNGDPMDLMNDHITPKKTIKESDDKDEDPQKVTGNLPVQHDSAGEDQNSNLSMNASFTNSDLKEIEELKIKLHKLGDRIASFEEGDHQAEYDSLLEKIKKLSSALNLDLKKDADRSLDEL